MKRIIVILTILIIMFLITNVEAEKVMIPENSIRFRVIANSNKEKDQINKKIVAKNLGKDVTNILKNTNNIEESRIILKNNINKFKNDIETTLKINNIEENYTIDYGKNYFPEKNYKGITYKSGEYESLVVKLGNGQGNNFWCVLFPPLCLLEGEETEKNDIEYKSFVKEVIDKYF